MNITKPILNNVRNRFLPISESVSKLLEPEPKIQDFEIIKELGVGSFGKVFLVTHKKTKAQYAIKAIDKKNKTNIEEKPYFRREIEIMYKVHHPNVVKLFGHFEDNDYCYFIMEYISKGNIYSLIPRDRKKKLQSQVVASLMKDVISAVYYLHNMNPPIIHRDIKPENVLLSEGLIGKLTDFGWSNYLQEENERYTVCGTPIYLAPEIINETGHDERVDIWCIGVLLFELSTGNPPFLGNDIETLKNNINHLKINWPKDIGLDVKNLIMKILKYDPKLRISLVEILNHPFFTKYFPNAASNLIKPQENLKYNIFVVSRDNPKTFNPICEDNNNKVNDNNNDKERCAKTQRDGNNSYNKFKRDVSPIPTSKLNFNKIVNTENNVSQGNLNEDYDSLKKNFEILRNEYNKMKSFSSGDLTKKINELKNQILEKDNSINNLIKASKALNDNLDELNDNKMNSTRIKELQKENELLKERISKYENYIKEHNLNISNSNQNINNIYKSEDINMEIAQLQSKLDDECRNYLDIILSEKDKEFNQIKEEDKITKEQEKKQFQYIISNYDKALSNKEKENKDLIMKINELQTKLANAGIS
jgi:aurora kinase